VREAYLANLEIVPWCTSKVLPRARQLSPAATRAVLRRQGHGPEPPAISTKEKASHLGRHGVVDAVADETADGDASGQAVKQLLVANASGQNVTLGIETF